MAKLWYNNFGDVFMSWKDDTKEKLTVGILELLILKLLSFEDMYGYQIMQEIQIKSKGKLQIKEGSLYGPLYRMEQRGYLSTRKELVGKKRFRVYYHLEDLGKEYIQFTKSLLDEMIEGVNYVFEEKKDEKWIKELL